MSDVDRLEVSVEAQATKANNSLDKLINRLNSVGNSLSRINSSGLGGLSNGIQKFATATAQLSSIDTGNLTKTANSLNRIAKIDSSKIFVTSSAIYNLSNSISSFSNVTFNADGLGKFANSLGLTGEAGLATSKALSMLAGDRSSFRNTELSAVMNNLQSGLIGQKIKIPKTL